MLLLDTLSPESLRSMLQSSDDLLRRGRRFVMSKRQIIELPLDVLNFQGGFHAASAMHCMSSGRKSALIGQPLRQAFGLHATED